MILRGTAVSAVAGALVAALAACSSAGIPAATTSSMSASVTQTAPSVWSAPDTVSTSAPGASSTAGTDGSSGTSTLPGLTEACSVAIRAQLVINDLFSDALQGGTTSTGTAAPATVSTAAASGISAAKVADVFGEITPSIPAPLSSALATLHDAANSIVGKPVTDIPAVLNSTDVTDAMNAFGSYIAACEPRATD